MRGCLVYFANSFPPTRICIHIPSGVGRGALGSGQHVEVEHIRWSVSSAEMQVIAFSQREKNALGAIGDL